MMRNLSAVSFLLIAMAAAAAPAAAQAPDCANATSQTDMTVCAGQSFDKADAALNAAYAKLRKGLSPASQSRLVDSQRAWIAFRDKECLMRSNGPDGGSVAPMIRASCAEDLTRDRTKAIEALGACAEGDLSCPR